MKSKQYCSVCKEWLDMEVVSGGDPEEDDGVTWYRCPGCQGFLPKLTAGADEGDADAGAEAGQAVSVPVDEPVTEAPSSVEGDAVAPADGELPWDSPGEMLDAAETTSEAEVAATLADIGGTGPGEDPDSDAAPGDAGQDGKDADEPIGEYAAMLEDMDPGQAVPYRPWETYELGQCVLHLAWNDCGVVVGKEDLPGGRRVIKCYFSEAGIVRLIENAPR